MKTTNNIHKIQGDIPDMHCSSCAEKVQNALETKEAVLDANVHINTGSHPEQEFNVEGTLVTSSGMYMEINGKGKLSHLYSENDISCLLNISFHFSQKDVTGFILSTPPDGDLHVEIIQTVLDNH